MSDLSNSRRPSSNDPDRHVCKACLGDPSLWKLVCDYVEPKECSYCDNRGQRRSAVPLEAVAVVVSERLSDDWDHPDDLYDDGFYYNWMGEKLPVFDTRELLTEIGFAPNSEAILDHLLDELPDQTWCTTTESLSADKLHLMAWERFKLAIKHRRRFTFWSLGDDEHSEWDPDYFPIGTTLSSVTRALGLAGMVQQIPQGTPLWRVRVHDAGVVLSRDSELGPPPVAFATQANRMSPSGIVMFYGSADFETACVETVSAALDQGKKVSGAAFATAFPMNILNLTSIPEAPSYFDPAGAEVRGVLKFLQHFCRDLVKPIKRDGREHVEYVPTQAFTEHVRFNVSALGDGSVHGLSYSSSRNGRPCYVLFCEQDNCLGRSTNSTTKQWLRMDNGSLRPADVTELLAQGGNGGH
jgi:hypothetical protein